MVAGNLLQAQSESSQKLFVAIDVEILHAVTFENYIPRLKEGDAASDGHILQLDLVGFVSKVVNRPPPGSGKGVP